MDLIRDLQGFLDTIQSLGGDARDLRVDPPAKEEEVQSVEKQIGRPIPAELRRAMLTVSARLEFRWFLEDAVELPDPLREIFSGDLHWGLDLTPDFWERYTSWVQDVFPKADDPCDAVWHNKFPFPRISGSMAAGPIGTWATAA